MAQKSGRAGVASHPHSARERDGAGGAQRGVLAAVATPVAEPHLGRSGSLANARSGNPTAGCACTNGKRAAVYYGCDVEAHLVMPETVA